MICNLQLMSNIVFNCRNSAKSREGALLGFECLCETLGRLFEPYVYFVANYMIFIIVIVLKVLYLDSLIHNLIQVCDPDVTTTFSFLL